jgi:hypothetical protein
LKKASYSSRRIGISDLYCFLGRSLVVSYHHMDWLSDSFHEVKW